MKQNLPPEAIQQRVRLPKDFVLQAESDALRVGLSLPTLLGLSARRAWQATVASLISEPTSLPEPHTPAERTALGLTNGPRRMNRKRGAK